MQRHSSVFCLFLFCVLTCAFYCTAEQGYLQIKDINIIMKQILDQHLDKKEVTASILKNSFKVYIDQFDPERTYLLQSEARPLSLWKLNSSRMQIEWKL